MGKESIQQKRGFEFLSAKILKLKKLSTRRNLGKLRVGVV